MINLLLHHFSLLLQYGMFTHTLNGFFTTACHPVSLSDEAVGTNINLNMQNTILWNMDNIMQLMQGK